MQLQRNALQPPSEARRDVPVSRVFVLPDCDDVSPGLGFHGRTLSAGIRIIRSRGRDDGDETRIGLDMDQD
jgi:hypothetical protein